MDWDPRGFVTLRWVKDMQTGQYHLLTTPTVRVVEHMAYHLTACGKVVPGKTFRDGFPPGADCAACVMLSVEEERRDGPVR